MKNKIKTDMSCDSYISPTGVYLVYRKLAIERKIEMGSVVWERMETVYNRLTKKEKNKYPPLKESDLNEEVIK
tara:strand:+ start:306 stop:524 length:219 start_codon:yes stop_codon:yes gene_type:complete